MEIMLESKRGNSMPMHNRYLCGLAVALGLLAGTISTKAQPNLVPYKPSGWSDKIVATTNSGGTTDTPNLTTLSDIYIDWAVANTGSAATSVTTDVDLYLDGELDNFWSISPPFDPSTFEYIEGYELGTLSAGTHTIVIVGDGTGVYGESDDTYTKTITVSPPSTPDLVPYKPSGWSDKIVVTRTSGSTNDSTNLTTADSLYLDWAVINSGSVATAATFYTYLYYDGVYVTDWSTPAPLNINSYTYVTGYSLGSLSAGNHSLEIYANATGTISETNTANNIYTKNITVSQPTLPAPALLAPANGGTGVAQSPTFSWSAVSGAASYRLIAATSAADLPSNPSATNGGPSVLLNVTTTNTSY